MLASTRHGLWASFDLKIFTIKSLTEELLQKVQVFGKLAKTSQNPQNSPKLAKIHQNWPQTHHWGVEGDGLGCHLGPPSPHSKLFLFCLVLHNYMRSGSFY
jgi:hypothetical protein